MKVIGIVKNNCITGVEYGVIEIPDREITNIKDAIPQKKHKKNNSKKIKNSKKHNSVKNTRIKTSNIEKETKSATKQNSKRRYRMHATITLSYNLKPSQKHPVDLTKKNFKKKQDLFKKKRRDEKIALQNLSQQFINIEPILDLIVFDAIEALNSIKQKTR